MNEDLAVLKADGKDFVMDLLNNFWGQSVLLMRGIRALASCTHLLPITRPTVFTLGPMNESRVFGVETVKTIGLLIHECIILRNKLPPDLGGDDILMNRSRAGIRVGSHYG